MDRSILSPAPVFETNLHGTLTLLEAARLKKVPRFLHVSTDEVYGSIEFPAEATKIIRCAPAARIRRPRPGPTYWRCRTL